jgi:predicted HAD superfamily Cof-like phosphohydrolase
MSSIRIGDRLVYPDGRVEQVSMVVTGKQQEQQMSNQQNFVERVLEFNKAAGRPEEWDTHLVAAHIGYQMEEMSEKLLLGVLGNVDDEFKRIHAWAIKLMASELHQMGLDFKSGFYDGVVANSNRKELLDADIDLSVFTVGSLMVQGSDVLGATNEVCSANERKKFEDGTYHKDTNGKIMKPHGWTPPDMTPFVGK